VGYLVKIHPENYLLYVEEGETILEAALKQAYDFPYSCQHGTCSTCMGRILSGEIDYLGVEPEGLTPDEKRLGYALMCIASPKTDLVIEVPGVQGPEVRPAKTLPYRATSIKEISDTVYQIILNPPEDNTIDFLAGQYVMIGRQTGEMRPYSIANAPLGGKHIELHVRHTDENTFTQAILDDLNNDQPIKIQGAFGRCIYHYIPSHSVILMAGGTGFSQSKALIEQMTTLNSETNIHLFWVAKTPADLYLTELAEEWVATLSQFKFTPIISNNHESWLGCTKRIEKAVMDTYPDLSRCVIYASGPQDMVFTALRDFEACGLERELMFSDAFEFADNP